MTLDQSDRAALVLWAADCAEHVLPLFEEQRRATTDRGEQSKRAAPGRVARSGSRSCVLPLWPHTPRRASDPAARAAARAAGHAAATAHVPTHAPLAATYAAKAARGPCGCQRCRHPAAADAARPTNAPGSSDACRRAFRSVVFPVATRSDARDDGIISRRDYGHKARAEISPCLACRGRCGAERPSGS